MIGNVIFGLKVGITLYLSWKWGVMTYYEFLTPPNIPLPTPPIDELPIPSSDGDTGQEEVTKRERAPDALERFEHRLGIIMLGFWLAVIIDVFFDISSKGGGEGY